MYTVISRADGNSVQLMRSLSVDLMLRVLMNSLRLQRPVSSPSTEVSDKSRVLPLELNDSKR